MRNSSQFYYAGEYTASSFDKFELHNSKIIQQMKRKQLDLISEELVLSYQILTKHS